MKTGISPYGESMEDFMTTDSYWKYFTREELKCKCGKCGSDGKEMKKGIMEPLDMLREKLGFPLVITSAYRCKWWNHVNNGSLKSAHLGGQAVDINIYYEKALQLVAEALKLKVFIGFGLKQKGELCYRCIHLDIKQREEPTIWSY